MNSTRHKILQVLMIAMTLLFVIETVVPKQSKAQWSDLLNFVPNTLSSIADTAQQVNSYYEKYKDSVLVPLIQALVQQILQQLTADIVDWINTGFKGNPAFVSNPGGFFADVADQTTGALIASNGALSMLCSPFNLDLRLNLALFDEGPRTRYSCTLNSVINNVKNSSASVSVGTSPNGATIGDVLNGTTGLNTGNLTDNPGAVSINGSSIDDFTSGDFASNGGWPAFLAMTSEPQNNAYGASQIAWDDRRTQIAYRQNTMNNDLNRGNGFMSWQKCDDLGIDPSVAEGDPTVTTRVEGDLVIYQRCETQTPGSVISGAINKTLGSPTDQLVAGSVSSSINSIINALFNYLLRSVLQNGLSSGYTTRSVNSLNDNMNNPLVIAQQKQSIINGLGEYLTNAQAYKDNEDQALATIINVNMDYNNVMKLCTDNGHDEEALALRDLLNANVTPVLSTYQNKDREAVTRLSTIENVRTAAENAQTTQQVTDAARQYSDLLSYSNVTTKIDVQNSTDDIKNAGKSAETLTSALASHRTSCSIVSNGYIPPSPTPTPTP